MIKFFRRIRQNLLTEGKTVKYFKYAIGEIILVVIGILIALQINNWNENRKDNFVELKILQSLNNDLITDINNLKGMIKNDSLSIQYNRQLISILKDESVNYDASMARMFGDINRYDAFWPQKMGFESLKSKGLEIIKNDKLKSEIVNLYDFQYAQVSESMDLKKQLYLNTNSIFLDYLETISSDTSRKFDDSHLKVPNDFNGLKKVDRFMNHLTHIYTERLIFQNYAKAALEKMKIIQKQIEKEITKAQQ
ncbi:DUF6090 family protein [Robiginitalea sp. IMCC44478]|uniref:DUF6090 family protein n=1 Tax=Robiginitalea sp. IMCC44478 TaxID=3459122 RepID=UPI004041EB60